MYERDNPKLVEFRGNKEIILKARQMGFSTYIGAKMFMQTINTPLTQTIILAQDETNSKRIFQMIRRFFDNLPPHKKRPVSRESTTELFWDDIDSYFTVGWAGSRKIGRGGTINNVHWCLHKNARIVLADGSSCMIKNISPGDEIVTSSGSFAKVKNVINSGFKQTIEISTWLNNEPVAMSPEHKVLTSEGYKQCGDLTINDWIAIPKIPITNKITSWGGFDLKYDFGYFLGYYLAEGHIRKQYSANGTHSGIEFTYHKDEDFIENVLFFVKDYCTSISHKDFDNKTETTCYGSDLANLVNDICGRTSNKHLPNWIFETNEDFLRGILCGYLDGDGSKCEYGMTRAVCVREKISRQMRRICITLGYGVPGIHFRNNRKRYDVKTQDVYLLSLMGDTYLKYKGGDNSRHKATKYKEINGNYFVKIRSIKEFEQSETYDIEVDHPDHNFETTIGIVSNSEPAFADSGRELVTGLLQAVPADGNVFLESTANGVGNYYYTEYMAALEQKSVYTPRFYPWFYCQEYVADRLIFDNEFIIDDEERELKTRVLQEFNFDISDSQLRWRRNKILELKNASLTDDSIGDFAQEYPSTVLEAFIATGSAFFDGKKIVQILLPQALPAISQPKIPITYDELFKVNNRTAGRLDIYKMPQPGRRYIVTGDPSEGLNNDGDHDYCSSDVIDADTFEQVATLHGRWEPHIFAKLLYELGMWFNLGVIIVERNNHGHSVINTLINELGYPSRVPGSWGGLYFSEDNKPGFHTNHKSKTNAANSLNKLVTDDSMRINSRRTLEQMRIFSHLPGNKLGAISGHDDCVTSLMLGGVILCDSNIMKRQIKASTGSMGTQGKRRIVTKRKVGYL